MQQVTFPSLSGSLAVLSSTTPQGGYRKVHLKAIPHALHVIGVSPADQQRTVGTVHHCTQLSQTCVDVTGRSRSGNLTNELNIA